MRSPFLLCAFLMLFVNTVSHAQYVGSGPEIKPDSNRWWIYPQASGIPPAGWAANPTLATGWIPAGIDPCTWAPSIHNDADRLLGSTFTAKMGLATAYFYTTFNVDTLSTVQQLRVLYIADDTAIFYINGKKVATGGDGGHKFFYKNIPKSVLVSGKNVLAVQLTNLHPGCFFVQAELYDVMTFKIFTRTSTKAMIYPTGIADNDVNTNRLLQNTPNPFNNTTAITYQLPAGTRQGAISIYDMTGREVKTFALPVANNSGTVTLEGSTLQAGMYLYSLIADGIRLDTKRMMLTR